MMDLDHFKSINDTHGHGVGDDVLRTYANTVHATMRDTDIFGRHGGEEFMLILTAITPGSALPALERIQAGVAAADWAAIVPGLAVTQSIGVAGFRKDENVGQLLNRADAALYEAKRTGRNRIVVSE
jgi:diguanylate cyclase (GGDEF)-like protein